VRIETFGLHEFIRVERESLRLLAEQAMSNLDPINGCKAPASPPRAFRQVRHIGLAK
jgi:hypothetical protein